MQYKWYSRSLGCLLVAWGLWYAAPGGAALLNISNTPLFLGLQVEPNVVLTIDDSGSMDWEVLTRDAANDGRFTGSQPNGTSPAGAGAVKHRDDDHNGSADCTFANGSFFGYEYIVEFGDNTYSDNNTDCNTGDEQEWRMRNSAFNALYFDPNRTYRPWPGVDKAGNLYTDMPITAAKANPYDPTSPTIDLTRHNSDWNDSTGGRSTSDRDGDGQPDGFRYYIWTDKNNNGLFDTRTGTDREETEYLIKNADAATQQNFANWFSYYRSREFVAKAAYSEIIANATNVRMGLVTLHNNKNGINAAITSVNTPVRSMNVDPTTGTKRALMDAVFSIHSNNGTPLRPTLNNIGQYVECKAGRTLFPLASDCPSLPEPQGGACQQNFVIFMTDGFDNGADPSVGNTDANGAGAFDGGAYADTFSNTLADVAMHYYERDLRTTLANKVPQTAGVDEASHQHMVTYTLSFGLDGLLSSDPPNRTSTFPWPDPEGANPAAKIDDLRHAAFNGRGLFLSARNPQQLSEALDNAFRSIAERSSSAASVALNSGVISTDSNVYQARFNSGDWSGQLLSHRINPDDGSLTSLAWDAATVLDGQDYNTGRQILTYKPSTRTGVPFRWTNLDPSQQTLLHTNSLGANDAQGVARLEYLRGSRAHEGKGNRYRARLHVLGDLVNSAPYYVGKPPYPSDLGPGYAEFKATYAGRTPMVLVGGNDGFLHVFNATTGQEMLAYLPHAAFSKINQLTFSNYSHRYYVDGSPTVVDVELQSGLNIGWRTVVVGGLRAGGQGFYALDVTDPSTFHENNASNTVLWEFTDAHDADLGLTYSQPSLVRMKNGRWAAVVGNGYNSTSADGRASTTGRAMLFIIFLDGGLDGSWTPGTDYIKIDTGAGSTLDPNGLSAPAPVDIDGDYTADYIVAGDLFGNLWTFDVTDPNPANWRIPYNANGQPAPFFVARNSSGIAQPITLRPSTWRHPDKENGVDGFMVYVGTGKYLEAIDDNPVGSTQQTFYGLWENGTGPIPDRTSLLQQTVVQQTIAHDKNVRVMSDHKIIWETHRGWFFDLPLLGEKQVSDPVLREGRLFFATLIPDPDVCSYGGTSWLMAVDAAHGGRLAGKPPFDLNDDGKHTQDDKVPDPSGAPDLVNIGGWSPDDGGILASPTILTGANGDFLYSSGSSGGIVRTELSARYRGRLSWFQLL